MVIKREKKQREENVKKYNETLFMQKTSDTLRKTNEMAQRVTTAPDLTDDKPRIDCPGTKIEF